MRLPFPRFLNLVQAYLSWQIRNAPETEEIRDQLTKLAEAVTGVPTTLRAKVIVDGREMTPPSWWIDDDDATASSFKAMRQL